MNAECRTIAPSDVARSADGASTVRRWRRSDVPRVGILAATVALAGCAGMPGATSPTSGSSPSGPVLATATTQATAASQAVVAQNPAAPFTASVSLIGSTPLRFGNLVSFVLSTSTAGHGHLYMLNASGKVVALAENLPMAPGARILFPPPGAKFAIRARPPAGTDRVLFLVTQQPFPGLGGGGAGAAPVTLAMSGDAFIANLNAATARLPGNGWVLAETRVEVVAAGG